MTESSELYATCRSDDATRQAHGYQTLWNYLYRVTYQVVRDQPSADALAQESAQKAIVKIHQQIETCRSPKAFKSWSRTIASRLAIDELRARKRIVFNLDEVAEFGVADQSADLRFLQPQPSVWDAVRQIGRNYHLQLTKTLLNRLTPSPTFTFAPRSDDDELGAAILQLEEREDAPFTFTLFKNGTLEVEVMPAGRAWPDLAGSRVTIQIGARRESQVTDAWGLVMFEGLPLAEVGKLTILVEPVE